MAATGRQSRRWGLIKDVPENSTVKIFTFIHRHKEMFMSTIKRLTNVVTTGRAAALGFCLTLLALICLAAAPAQAQQNRTWVASFGSDLNPACARTSPCQTFTGALAKTNAGGEINCLDSGSYGILTINKSISILCEGVVGGILAPAAIGVTVNASATDVVVLRGLDINGVGTGFVGIQQLAAGSAALHIEDCRIHDFNGFAGTGIDYSPPGAASSELYVTNTTIAHNGAAGGGGIRILSSSGSPSKVTINHSNVQNNTTGIKADGASGGVINMTIRDTASVGNTQNGIVGTTPAGGAAIVIMLDHVAASHNAAGYGVIADGPATFITVGGSSIAGNAFGVGTSNGGTLLSLKTNQIRGNSSDGTPIAAVGLE